MNSWTFLAEAAASVIERTETEAAAARVRTELKFTMKTAPLTLVAAIAIVGTSNLMAQGSVIFNNRRGTTTHVWASSSSLHITGNAPNDNPTGNTDYSGNTLIGTAGALLAANTTLASLL